MPINKLNILNEDSFNVLYKQASTEPESLLGGSKEIKEFNSISQELELSTEESNYLFDYEAKLILPRSGSWSDNNDRRNCDIIYDALPGLTATEATDERLWASLSFIQFGDYCNARWPLSPKADAKALSKSIHDHWFASTARSRWRDNAVSRLWWMSFYAHSFEELTPSTVLNILCLNADLVGSLLGRPLTSNNRTIAKFLLKELQQEYLGHDAPPFQRIAFRETLKELDLRAGRYFLAALDEEHLAKLVREVFRSFH